MSRPRLLVLRALGVGDLLTAVPALRALRRALPDHELVLATHHHLRPLVDLTGAVDRLLPTGELQPVPWAGQPPDVAVDLHGNGPASRRLLEVLRPRRLVGFSGPELPASAGPAWLPDEHERHRWCRLVSESFGVLAEADDVHLAHPPAEAPAHGALVVHPGAASGSRRWPVERFAAVSRALAGDGHRVLVTGSSPEAPLAEDVRRRAGLPQSSVLAGRTDLAGLTALVASARLVVCGDTGIGHLASAYRTPSVLLFGPTPPSWWGPPANGPHTVLWHDLGRGDPHGETVDPALARITVDEVLAAARLRLERAVPPASSARPAPPQARRPASRSSA